MSKHPKLLITNKGFPKLLDELNFSYSKHKTDTMKTKQYWRCTNRLCNARVTTNISEEDINIIGKSGEHNHTVTAFEAKANNVVNDLKKKCVDSQDAPRSL
jgi:hypothetical protein